MCNGNKNDFCHLIYTFRPVVKILTKAVVTFAELSVDEGIIYCFTPHASIILGIMNPFVEGMETSENPASFSMVRTSSSAQI